MVSKRVSFICLTIFVCFINLTESIDDVRARKPLNPAVIWHGPMECGTNKDPQRTAKSWEKYGKKAKVVAIESSCEAEQQDSIYMKLDKQVMAVCQKLIDDSDLKNGFTLIGLSEGGALGRGLVEMCPELNITDLITFAAPHQGFFGIPDPKLFTQPVLSQYCDFYGHVRELFSNLSPTLNKTSCITPLVNAMSNNFTLGSLWVDPTSSLPADNFINAINNKLSSISFSKQNLLKLENFIAIQFAKDKILIPKESATFGYFKDGSETEIIPYNQTDLYTQDYIGLKELDERGKFIPIECPSGHMQHPDSWFEKNIIERFYDV